MSSILENINSHINEGKFYEASQMYKVLIMRYAKNGKLDTSIQLAIKGIKTMFQSKKVALSSEIAYTLVKDVLEKYEFKMDQVVRLSATLQLTVLQILSDIVKMYNDCGQLEKGELESKVRFLKAAVIFSAAKNKSAATTTTENTASDQTTSTKKKKSESASASDQGEPSLHLVLAKTYEQLGDFKKANTQFIRSHDMNEYAKMLIHWSLDSRQALITLQQAPASESDDDDEKQQKTLQTLLLNEDDLLLTRSLLQVILGTNSHLEAKQLFDAYLKLFKQEMGADLKKPLIQFDRFLLLAVEKKNYDLLNKSMKSYEQELSRDPKIQDLLKNVTSNVFGIKVADNSMAGMLNSMLGSLMGGGSSSNSGGAAANSNPMAALLGSLGGAAPRPSNNSPSSIVDDDLD